MKLQFKLGLACAGVLSVAAIAGCPNGNPLTNPTTAPTVAPTGTPSPAARTTTQKVVFTNVVFQTASSVAGQHYVYIKNLSGADITNFNNYVLAFYPSGATRTGALATSPIVTGSGSAISTFANNGSLKVYLYNNTGATAGTEATVTWPLTTVQYSAGGELALFNAQNATASSNITDYVRWGATSTSIQPVAVQAGLWNTGDTLATASVASATTGASTSVKVPGGMMLSNWTPITAF